MDWIKRHPIMTGFVVVILFLFASYFSKLIPIRTENTLYNQLYKILLERGELWSTPRAEGGTRERDISHLVCPLVSEEKLNEMYSSLKYSRKLEYNYYETSVVYPDNSKRWIIKKYYDPLRVDQIIITLASEGYCRVDYRNMK